MSLPSASSARTVPVSELNESLLVCPQCRAMLVVSPAFGEATTCTCVACEQTFAVRVFKENATLRLQADLRPDAGPVSDAPELDDTEAWQNRIKLFLRQSPWLYRFLVYVIGPALLLGPTSQTFVNRQADDAVILNLGCGVRRLKPRASQRVIHLDYEPYAHLEVVGDAHFLPFTDASLDAVVCETMLEHVPEPERVIAEMTRVLKPGGRVFVLMPFMFGFHAAPNDFERYTHKGLLFRMRGFACEQLKVIAGPASALTGVLVEFCAMVCSLGMAPLYRVFSLAFLVVFAPLKLLDFILCFHPEASRIASIFLFVGRKK
ncbi:MAG: methyltransferase domain-containing protein [Candidatus Melainabacteria bacterium]